MLAYWDLHGWYADPHCRTSLSFYGRCATSMLAPCRASLTLSIHFWPGSRVSSLIIRDSCGQLQIRRRPRWHGSLLCNHIRKYVGFKRHFTFLFQQLRLRFWVGIGICVVVMSLYCCIGTATIMVLR
ncbi:hypothetical protein SCLCIDRAFT_403105 [Scleroderma citrinum Foug A]|uniref:Uncharacterized protein n=1 Tax=Scleroderma citrinum Foug A TaxID=1036808 RepID=A0A0C3DC03_9AGAM|nr:hypothetical protein SCLCIDRAFT_403105 [Scleroderma citrinum Foug A]